MKLERLTERVWVYPYEEERDRPNLSYIKGDRWSLAVDAGHSDSHVREFRSGSFLGRPYGSTCFGNDRVADIQTIVVDQFRDKLHESIRREYEGGKPVIVTPADLLFRGEMQLDAGNCPIRIFQAEAPHTDDSTLIFLPEEKLLILGDCTGGTFPDWTVDQPLADQLAEPIRGISPATSLPGHYLAKPILYSM